MGTAEVKHKSMCGLRNQHSHGRGVRIIPAISSNLRVKRLYIAAFLKSGHKQQTEAQACEVDQSHVSRCLSEDHPQYNITLGAAIRSLVGNDLLAYFAAERGFALVPTCGKLDGRIHDNKCAIGHATVDLLNTEDDVEELRLLHEIVQQGLTAIEEMKKGATS